MNTSNKKSWWCNDLYMLATINKYKFKTIYSSNTLINIEWEIPAPAKELHWDIQHKGIRVLLFSQNSWWRVIWNILNTSILFGSFTTRHVPSFIAEANYKFLKENNINIKRNRYYHTSNYTNYSNIKSGDILGILRLDGLDPLLAIAQGATTGHVVLAVKEKNKMFILESTDESSYWYKPGIQATPIKEWLYRARKADFNIVWASMNEKYRKKFDSVAGMKWFRQVEGHPYGFETMLWSWIDNTSTNLLCFNSGVCLTNSHLELALSFLDNLYPSFFSNIIRPRFKKVLENMNIIPSKNKEIVPYKLLYKAGINNFSFSDIASHPLKDNDTYIRNNTKHYSLVCSSFVAMFLKNAGIFKDVKKNISATEFVINDIYQSKIYQQQKFLAGKYIFKLNSLGTKEI